MQGTFAQSVLAGLLRSTSCHLLAQALC